MSQTLLNVESLRVALSGVTVVDGVRLRLAAGELVALVGPNGSGKTTFIRALLGLVPSSGVIDWVGNPGLIAASAAYLPQSPTAVIGQSVGQTILAGCFAQRRAFDFVDRAEDARHVEQIAEQLGLTALLGRGVDRLSGGQRQRVFLARCLAQRTPALILDEPATYLDLRHQVELYRLLARLTHEQGKGILMASHDLNLAAVHADRIVVLADGKIVADGPPEVVMDPALIERVYGVRMRRVDVDGVAHLVPLE